MTVNQGRRNWLKYFLFGGLICTPVLTFWGKKYFLKNKKQETIDSIRHGIYFPTPQITSTLYTQRVCLSPDGKRIAISGTAQYNGIRLFTANAEKLFTDVDTQYDGRIESSSIGNILALSMSEQPDYSIAYVHREISKNPLDVASFNTLEEYVKYVNKQKFSDRLYCLRSKEEKPFLLYEAKTSIDLNFCFDNLINYQLCWINQSTIVFYNENDILSITTNGNVKKIYSVAVNGKKIVSNMFYDTKLNQISFLEMSNEKSDVEVIMKPTELVKITPQGNLVKRAPFIELPDFIGSGIILNFALDKTRIACSVPSGNNDFDQLLIFPLDNPEKGLKILKLKKPDKLPSICFPVCFLPKQETLLCGSQIINYSMDIQKEVNEKREGCNSLLFLVPI